MIPKPYILQNKRYGEWKDYHAFHRLDWAKAHLRNHQFHYPKEWQLVERTDRVIENE